MEDGSASSLTPGITAEGSWPLPTQVIRDLAATIAALEARLAIAQLEDLVAGADERPPAPEERRG